MTASTTFSAGTVVTSNWLNTINDHVFEYNFNVKDFGAVGDGVADDTAAIQAAITAAQGQPIYVPKGTYVITSTLTQTAPVTWGVFSPGLKIYGAGVGVTFFDNRVTTGPMIDIDSLTHGGGYSASMGSVLFGFNIITTTGAGSKVGIRVLNGYQIIMEQLVIKGMFYGIELKNGLYVDDGWNRVAIRNSWIEACTGWGIKADGSAARNEGSYTYLEQVFFQTNGTSDGGANPPTSGAMIWKGQILVMESVAAANGNQNVAFYFKGDSGLGQSVDMRNCTSENTYGWGVFCTGISVFKTRGCQIYNNTVYTAPVLCEFDASTYTVREVDWDGGTIRAAGLNMTGSVTGTVLTITSLNGITGQNIVIGSRIFGTGVTAGSTVTSFGTGTGGLGTYNLSASSAATGSITITGATTTAFKISGGNALLDTCRVRNINWENFDFPNQTRFNGWQFDAVPFNCELAVLSTTSAVLRPKAPLGSGNKMPYRLRGFSGGVASTTGEWVAHQIASGGLSISNASLAINTRYYCYLFDNNGSNALELSTTAYVTDTATGYPVKSGDPAKLYVGSVATDGTAQFLTSATGWLNPTPIASSQVGTYIWMWYSSTSGALRRTIATLPASDTDGALV